MLFICFWEKKLNKKFYTLIPNSEFDFVFLEQKDFHQLKRHYFILESNDIDSFLKNSQSIKHELSGIIFSCTKKQFNIQQKTKFLWAININDDLKKEDILKILEQQLNLLLKFKSTDDKKRFYKLNFERQQKEINKHSEYISIVERTIRRNFEKQSKWSIDVLSELVNFAAIELEPAQLEDFPELIMEFLRKHYFDYSYSAFLKYNNKEDRWEELSFNGERNVEIDFIPTFDDNMTLEEEKEYYSFFSINKESFLLLVSRNNQNKNFTRSENSFFSLLATLISSYYHMKRLAKDIENRMVEINTMNMSSTLISKLKESHVNLEFVFDEVFKNLPLEGVILARLKENEKMEITLQRNIEVDSWNDFLEKVFLNETYFTNDWRIYPLSDEQMKTYGAVACQFSKDNPALSSIQTKVMDSLISQITTILSQRKSRTDAEKFHTQSITDALTGAYNRRYGLYIFEKLFKKVKERGGHLSAAMIDIDHFKNVNDTYGHLIGDKVLKTVVQVVSDTLRDEDIICRYGGEEFLLIMEANAKAAKHVCERIRKKVEETIVDTETMGKMSVTISLGTATFHKDLTNIKEFIAESDKYLYAAKENGRNRVVNKEIFKKIEMGKD